MAFQYELATNEFPYEKWGTPFAQLRQVVKEASPKLPEGRFSPELDDFVDQWYVWVMTFDPI